MGSAAYPDDALGLFGELSKLPPDPSVPPPTRDELIELFDRVKFHPLSLCVLAQQLKLEHQVCHFHVLRWVWRALADLRKQLPDEHHPLIDEVWQIMKERPAQGRARLFELWQALTARRSRDQRTSALYRLRLLILRLHEKWERYTLDQRQPDVPATNNATERAIGRWRIHSQAFRGFKN